MVYIYNWQVAYNMHQPYNLIIPQLYLGDYSSAGNSLLLQKLGVTSLVSIDLVPPSTILPQLVIQIYDKEDEDLLSHLPSIVEFISKEIRVGGTVFVHCFHGVSRSASGLIAYLMKVHGSSLTESLSLVKMKRPSVEPNVGFMKQLRLYSRMNCSLEPSNAQYRLYKFLNRDPLERSIKGKLYKCKKCGYKIHLDIFLHGTSHKFDWSEEPINQSLNCSKGIFVEELHANLDEEDKIRCAKCLAKIGRFSLNQEIACPCGSLLPHGYWINLSKMDDIKFLDLSLLR